MRNRKILLLFCIFSFFAAAEKWTVLEKCKLKPNYYNDGDSFHVIHKGKEYIFRLYFVDTPETSAKHKSRVKDQAKYWKISLKETLRLGQKAKKFTAKALKGKFTVYTKFDDAKGSSKLPRYFAFVKTSSGKDLAELLVSNGLARIYGMRASHPKGDRASAISKKLKKCENIAKKKKIGGWRK